MRVSKGGLSCYGDLGVDVDTQTSIPIPLATLVVGVALANSLIDRSALFQIGFLNDKNPESKLDAFLDTFDIVLVNESSMQLPTTLIKLICDNA